MTVYKLFKYYKGHLFSWNNMDAAIWDTILANNLKEGPPQPVFKKQDHIYTTAEMRTFLYIPTVTLRVRKKDKFMFALINPIIEGALCLARPPQNQLWKCEAKVTRPPQEWEAYAIHVISAFTGNTIMCADITPLERIW